MKMKLWIYASIFLIFLLSCKEDYPMTGEQWVALDKAKLAEIQAREQAALAKIRDYQADQAEAYTRKLQAEWALDLSKAQTEIKLKQLTVQHRVDLQITENIAFTQFTLAVAWRLAIILLLFGIPLAIFIKYRRKPVYPDGNGYYPIPSFQLGSQNLTQMITGYVEMKGLASVEGAKTNAEALVAAVDLTTKVAKIAAPQRVHITGSSVPLPQPVMENPSPAAPSFEELLTQGDIRRGRLILGFNEQGPILGSWKDLYSSAICGLPGTGKSTLLRFILSQSALNGAKFVVVDPHGEAEEGLSSTLEPLSPCFLCPPIIEIKKIIPIMKRLEVELDRRLKDPGKHTPIILCIDEFTKLMRSDLAERLSLFLERIVQEGRKERLFALLSGQIWTSHRTGGTSLRDALSSVYSLRQKSNQARTILPSGDAKRVERLHIGEALLYRTSGESQIIKIPLTTSKDIEQVSQMIPMVQTGKTWESPPKTTESTDFPKKETTPGNRPETPVTEEEKLISEIKNLAGSGKSVNQIIKVFWPEITGGRKWMEKSKQIKEILGK